jgi:hypothetical protein
MTSVVPNDPANEHSTEAGSAGMSRRGVIRTVGAGALALGLGAAMKLVADNVQTVVIPGAGHWVEQAPDQVLAALTAFLAPYRAAAVSVR